MPKSPIERPLNARRGRGASARGGKDRRGRDLARIHILKAQLRLSEEVYHGILWARATVESAADLDSHGRAEVIKHLEALVSAQGGKAKPYPKQPHNLGGEKAPAELEKIRALLADAGLPWTYAESILRNQTRGRKWKLEFASAYELVGVVAALHRAALKRLGAELERALGDNWQDVGAVMAALLFDFDFFHRTFAAYPMLMSQVLRWRRGELAASCAWPPASGCCIGCAQRLRAQLHQAVRARG